MSVQIIITLPKLMTLSGICAADSIQVEQYYAVYYTDPPSYYIGRVVKLSPDHAEMQFLKQDRRTNTFAWPRKATKAEDVLTQFIFSGPITLKGTGPFYVESLPDIVKRFNKLKKTLK